jgi:C4-dicarboxylate-specific signal transduction histidine kinase
MQVLDLNSIVESAISLVSHSLKLDDVEIGAQLSSRLPGVLGDRVQLEHLVVSVIRKCAKGREGGSIKILTEIQDSAGKVLLEVRHEGDQIASRRCDRPCPTRPDKDAGSCYDLLVARCISQAHGGDVAVDSTPGGGLALRIVLPRAESKDLRSRGQE